MNNEKDVKEKINETQKKAGEMFDQSMKEVKNQTEKLKENIADYAVESPFKLLGSVLLAGIAIGYLIHK